MRILICIDKSLSTEKVLMTAKTVIDNFRDKTHVNVIHIIDESLTKSINGTNDLLLNELKQESIKTEKLAKTIIGNEINYFEGYGNPQEKIVEFLNEIDYDILIMGSHGRTGLKHLLMGSVTQYVLKHSRKPNLIIPTHANS